MNKGQHYGGRAWIELDGAALRHNVRVLRAKLPETCRLMPALKADAYGHGAVLIAKELNSMGINSFCVACAREGVALRKQGIKGEILILGYTHPAEFYLLRRYCLAQTVIDYRYAVLLNRCGRKIHVHIGIDTGMHRLGERSENIDKICGMYRMKNLVIDGIYTHLCADDGLKGYEREYTYQQADKFHQMIEEMKKEGLPISRLHMQSSYSVLNYPELSGDYARVGIALYGLLGTAEDTGRLNGFLEPVLSLKARVALVKKLYAGESAGYGMEFRADHDMEIATITIGYADGFPRALSKGRGTALINGHRAPILGLVCMDQTIVDISGILDVKPGDAAVLIGKSGDKEISACDLAEEAGTITNEILSRLGARLERVVI